MGGARRVAVGAEDPAPFPFAMGGGALVVDEPNEGRPVVSSSRAVEPNGTREPFFNEVGYTYTHMHICSYIQKDSISI